jgi:hypothetical protein
MINHGSIAVFPATAMFAFGNDLTILLKSFLQSVLVVLLRGSWLWFGEQV